MRAGGGPRLRPPTASSRKRTSIGAISCNHTGTARARLRAHAVALCIQDTTELDFNGQGIAGLGPGPRSVKRRDGIGVVQGKYWISQINNVDAIGIEETFVIQGTVFDPE